MVQVYIFSHMLGKQSTRRNSLARNGILISIVLLEITVNLAAYLCQSSEVQYISEIN
jgi:hypothetical protein